MSESNSTINGQLHWEDPPPRRRGYNADPRIEAWIAELKLHPGEWARLPDRKSNSVSANWRARGFESASRNQGTDPGSKVSRCRRFQNA